MLGYYPVEREISIPVEADRRFEDPSSGELDRAERKGQYAPRCIGGELGDVYFTGFTVLDGKTILNDATLFTGYDMKYQDDVDGTADETVKQSFAAIGVECLY